MTLRTKTGWAIDKTGWAMPTQAPPPLVEPMVIEYTNFNIEVY